MKVTKTLAGGTEIAVDMSRVPDAPAETACDRMEQDGRTLIEIATALRQLPDDETRLCVIRAVAALYGVDLGVRR